MPLAVLSIDLEARLAKFEADLGRASRSLDKLADNARSSFSGVRDVFVGSFAASAAEEGIRQLIGLFPALIEGVGAFQDLQDETGASAAALAGFQTAADVSGVKVDQLAGLMIRLTSNLGKITDEGRGAGQALGNLGLKVDEFRRLAPEVQIQQLSAAFNGFEDGVGKTSNALALFGKNGPQILKFFKEYGDGSEQAVRLTAQQIALADDYSDRQARLRSELRQTAQVLAIQAIPALTALGDGFKNGALAIFNLQTSAGDLKADRSILDFAEAGAIAVGTLAESLVGVVKLAAAVKGSFSAVAADVKFAGAVVTASPADLGRAIFQGTGPVAAALAARNATVSEANDRYLDLVNYNGTAITDALRKSFGEQRRLLDDDNRRESQRLRERAATLAGTKPTLASVNVPDQAAKAQDSAFQRLLANLQQRQQIAQEELDSGQKLGESDRLRIETLTQLTRAEEKLTPAQQARVRAALDAATAVIKANEQQVERIKLLGAETRAMAQLAQQQDQTNQQLADQVAEIGLATEAVDRLKLARLSNKLAQQEEATAALQLMGLQGDELVQRQQLADGLRREIQLRGEAADKRKAIASSPLEGAQSAITDYLRTVEEAGTATRQAVASTTGALENDLTNSLASGRATARTTVDAIISEFFRLQVVRPLLASIFGQSGLPGLAASFFGGGRSSSAFDYNALAALDGARASGGAANPFGDYLVGEFGPEVLRMGSRGGTVLSNRALGAQGGTFITNIYADSGTQIAQMRAFVDARDNRLRSEIQGGLARPGGAYRRAAEAP